MDLSLLLLEFLLLQILDLRVNVGDGFAWCRRIHKMRSRHALVCLCRRHCNRDWVLLNHAVGASDHVGYLGVAHDGVAGLIAALEVLEVELHVVGHVVHATHVKELVELVIMAGGHMLVLAIPGSRGHCRAGAARWGDAYRLRKGRLEE